VEHGETEECDICSSFPHFDVYVTVFENIAKYRFSKEPQRFLLLLLCILGLPSSFFLKKLDNPLSDICRDGTDIRQIVYGNSAASFPSLAKISVLLVGKVRAFPDGI
jgi:hypothetical protein